MQRGRQGGDFNEPLTSVVSNLGTCGFVGPNCWFPGEDSGSVDLVVVVSQLFVPTDLVKFHMFKSKVKKDLVLEMAFREVAEILIFQTGKPVEQTSTAT